MSNNQKLFNTICDITGFIPLDSDMREIIDAINHDENNNNQKKESMSNYSQFISICKSYGFNTPEAEYKFHPKRKWKFDFAFVHHKVAIEIEGGVWTSGRHTRGSGFVKDMEKYNAATELGWRILRFTPSEMALTKTYDQIGRTLNQ